MKKQCENERFLMAQNHVWRYTLRLFHTFSIFEKSWKFDAKREAKSCHFWSKMRPWTVRGRFIQRFLTILKNTKNQWFFDVALDVEKSIKNRALEPQRPKTALRVIPSNRRVGHFGHRGTQGGGHNQRYSKNINKRIEKQILTRRGPLARRIYSLVHTR